jgi:thiosulfate dehydrogenase [quinone] large subunit
MEKQDDNFIKLFLRLAIAAGFLSAVADRFGMWDAEISVWGNWANFVAYTELLNPWFPTSFIPAIAVIATAAEILFAVCLIVGFKTELSAKLSGILLLIFALSMTFSTGIKGAFDYSVFAASAAAFALSTLKGKSWELDGVFASKSSAS